MPEVLLFAFSSAQFLLTVQVIAVACFPPLGLPPFSYSDWQFNLVHQEKPLQYHAINEELLSEKIKSFGVFSKLTHEQGVISAGTSPVFLYHFHAYLILVHFLTVLA